MSKKNRIVARGLGITLSSVMVAGTMAPSAVRASDWAFVSGEETIEEVPAPEEEVAYEDGGEGDLFDDPVLPVAPEQPPAGDEEDPTFFSDPAEDGGDVTLPTQSPDATLWDDVPSVATPTPGAPDTVEILIPEEVIKAEDDPGFVPAVSVTPTPGFVASVSVTPSPTPLTAAPVVINTTTQMSNLHAGKEFYLNSLKSRYSLTFSDDFGKVMDEIEYEYLAANNLIRPDGSRGMTDAAFLDNERKKQEYLLAQIQQDALTSSPGSDLVVLDLVGDSFTAGAALPTVIPEAMGIVTLDDLGLVGAPAAVTDVPVAVANPLEAFTSGETTIVQGATPEGLLARNWQDVLAIYVNNRSKTGVLDFHLDRSAKAELAAIFAELNPIQVNGNEASYANLHVTDYVKIHNIPQWERGILKQFTETDCKLLCATVTAAKGFIRQSVGESVSEERVNVLAAAYSLVGKVGYFWGGKSTYLGNDPRWGMAQFVTSEGSSTSGSLRAYGLDCSGFVTWAVINGYQNQGMQALVGDGTSDQWLKAKVVSEADAQPGDFVFQAGPEAGANNHVGILVGKTDAGDWIAVHCSSSQNGVTVGEAYSASFRYIREPSFYPPKVRVLSAPQESLDQIIVPADYPSYDSANFYDDATVAMLQAQEAQLAQNGLVFSDGLGSAAPQNLFGSTAYYNEDFMDIVLFDSDMATVSTEAASDDGFFYQDVPNTGGLVVLDESGRGDNLDYLTWPKNEVCFEATDVVVFDEAESVPALPEAAGVVVLDEEESVPVLPDTTDFVVTAEEPSLPVYDEVVLEDLSLEAALDTSDSVDTYSPWGDVPVVSEEVPVPVEEAPIVSEQPEYGFLPEEAKDLVVISFLSEEEEPVEEEVVSATDETSFVGDSFIASQGEVVIEAPYDNIVLDRAPDDASELMVSLPVEEETLPEEEALPVILDMVPSEFTAGIVSLDYVGATMPTGFISGDAMDSSEPASDLMASVEKKLGGAGKQESPVLVGLRQGEALSQSIFEGALKKEAEKKEESLEIMQSFVVLE